MISVRFLLKPRGLSQLRCVDTARDIYRNATLEKLALIQLISRRENITLESLTFLHAHLEVRVLDRYRCIPASCLTELRKCAS